MELGDIGNMKRAAPSSVIGGCSKRLKKPKKPAATQPQTLTTMLSTNAVAGMSAGVSDIDNQGSAAMNNVLNVLNYMQAHNSTVDPAGGSFINTIFTAFKAMQAQISELTVEIKKLSVKMSNFEQKITDSNSNIAPSRSYLSVATPVSPLSQPAPIDIPLVIQQTLNDATRRKRNVVVSGLPEDVATGISDRITFLNFCENFLPFKPSLAPGDSSCTRIGKTRADQPRRLLVKFNSEDVATAILKEAPSLRRCADPYISSRVYINPDLSPAAAKLAYDARKKYAARKSAIAGADTDLPAPLPAPQVSHASACQVPSMSNFSPPTIALPTASSRSSFIPTGSSYVIPSVTTPDVSGYAEARSFPATVQQTSVHGNNISGVYSVSASQGIVGNSASIATFIPPPVATTSYWPSLTESYCPPPSFQQVFQVPPRPESFGVQSMAGAGAKINLSGINPTSM